MSTRRYLSAAMGLLYLLSCSGGGSNSGSQNAPVAPSITTQPSSQTVTLGQTATFKIVVGGTSPITYQWARSNQPIAGATSATYSFKPVLTDSGATFNCLVSNVAGSVTSRTVTLTVNQTGGPVIQTQPSDQAVTLGQQASFTVVASGNAPLAYQWFKSGTSISGATSATYSFTPVLADDQAAFTCKISNAIGSVTSDPATLTVSTAGMPAIQTQPSNQTIVIGQQVSFSVVATGNPPLSYQWFKSGTSISGATKATYTYTPPLADNHATFACKISNSIGSVTSSNAALVIQASAPAFTLQPVSIAVVEGSAASFAVDYFGQPTPTCQWKKDGTNISGATAKALSYSSVALTDAGVYQCVASNSQGSATSNSATLTVTPKPHAPVFTLQPVSQGVISGTDVTFSVDFTGTPTPTCKWQKNNIDITGATSKTLTLHSVAVSDSGSTYRCIAINSAGSATSSVATLTVSAAPEVPSITLQPANRSVTDMSDVTFTVNFKGVPTPTCQWQKNGTNISGAVSNTLTLKSVALSDSGSTYRCRVTNSQGTVTSNSATLTVTPLLDVVVSPSGVKGNPGTPGSPTTIEDALAALAKFTPATDGTLQITLRGGVYRRSQGFYMDAVSNSSTPTGTAKNPILFAAYPGETPRFVGGLSISPSSFKLATSSDPNWTRLDSTARSKIYVYSNTAFKSNPIRPALRADDSGELNQFMEVFTDGSPLTLARYPKAVDAGSVNLAPQADLHVSGNVSPDVTGDYTYMGTDTGTGKPYYRLTKGGYQWTIAFKPNSGGWSLSNPSAAGTGSYASWGSYENFSGPAGGFDANSYVGGASGTAFIAPKDGTAAMPGFMLVQSSSGSTQIHAPDSHMSRWNASEAMYFGYPYYGYISNHLPVASFDASGGNIQLASDPGTGFRVGRPFFLYNLLEELTDPGEYFIDSVNGRLYFRPIGDALPAEIIVSSINDPLIYMRSVNYVAWQGVTFEGTLNKLVEVDGCNNITFQKCKFRNSGSWGLLLSGYRNLVDGCEFSQLGKGGIWICGGDRATLTPSNSIVQNCDIHHFGRLFWTYQPGIQVTSLTHSTYNDDCDGITLQHNEVHHSPHTAILFKGNQHLIQFNHVHHSCQWSNDVGAIYTGRDWGCQGNLIQFNLIRECGSPFGTYASGIYLDGCASGITAKANIFYQDTPNFAIEHNGGRDNHLLYNIMVGHIYGIETSNVGLSVINNTPGSKWNLLALIEHFNYQSGIWASTYPLLAAIPDNWGTLAGSHWLQPENCSYYGNVHFGSSSDLFRVTDYAPSGSGLKSPDQIISVSENLEGVDPQFQDPANLDFTLKPTSPVLAIPGFPGIDATQIGIQK